MNIKYTSDTSDSHRIHKKCRIILDLRVSIILGGRKKKVHNSRVLIVAFDSLGILLEAAAVDVADKLQLPLHGEVKLLEDWAFPPDRG